MTFQLKQVSSDNEIPALYALLVICGEHMHRTLGLSHWYPFRPYEVYLQQLDKNRLYAIYDGDFLAGTFALNETPRPYYTPDLWASPNARAIYFGLFGVLPAFQKRGLGRWAMQQVDQLAQADGFEVIRFDAVANHPKLLGFYDGLGYVQRGIVSAAPNRMNTSAMCYERVFEERLRLWAMFSHSPKQ